MSVSDKFEKKTTYHFKRVSDRFEKKLKLLFQDKCDLYRQLYAIWNVSRHLLYIQAYLPTNDYAQCHRTIDIAG